MQIFCLFHCFFNGLSGPTKPINEEILVLKDSKYCRTVIDESIS